MQNRNRRQSISRVKQLEGYLVRACKLLESDGEDFADEASLLCEEIREEMKVD